MKSLSDCLPMFDVSLANVSVDSAGIKEKEKKMMPLPSRFPRTAVALSLLVCKINPTHKSIMNLIASGQDTFPVVPSLFLLQTVVVVACGW